MTSTPRSAGDSSLNDSWVEVENERQSKTPVGGQSSNPNQVSILHRRVRNPNDVLPSQAVERLLREVQKESGNDSSAISSRITSNCISPVSPLDSGPVSPVEPMDMEDLLERNRQITSDWIWDWTQRSDSFKSHKDFTLKGSVRSKKVHWLNLRQWAFRRGVFSKEVLSLLLLTNILSLFLGTGIGYAILVRRSV